MVSKISEYANSQNKVRTTDFSSNHPFQVLMETLSRKIVAPQKKGTIMQTKWFYERARGQYAQQKSSFSSQSEKKKFEKVVKQKFREGENKNILLDREERKHETLYVEAKKI